MHTEETHYPTSTQKGHTSLLQPNRGVTFEAWMSSKQKRASVRTYMNTHKACAQHERARSSLQLEQHTDNSAATFEAYTRAQFVIEDLGDLEGTLASGQGGAILALVELGEVELSVGHSRPETERVCVEGVVATMVERRGWNRAGLVQNLNVASPGAQRNERSA
jgi:hypothetical protein